jgi:predicted nucleic acid-binding protein
VIALDTSVLVRYLVGTPEDQARAAAGFVDGADEDLGISPVALVECAHVLRTQYEVPQPALVDALLGLVQRENVRILGMRTDAVVQALVRVRTVPARPIPDALILAAAADSEAVGLATFDRGQARYGFPVVVPGQGPSTGNSGPRRAT